MIGPLRLLAVIGEKLCPPPTGINAAAAATDCGLFRDVPAANTYSDSELLTLAAIWIQRAVDGYDPAHFWGFPRTLVAELRDRAAQFAALESQEPW